MTYQTGINLSNALLATSPIFIMVRLSIGRFCQRLRQVHHPALRKPLVGHSEESLICSRYEYQQKTLIDANENGYADLLLPAAIVGNVSNSA